MNKVKIILLSVLLALPLMASAQYRTLEFFYIAHDYSTRVDAICDMLEEKYESALEFDDMSLIFYLPNGEQPKVFKMNVPGDNRQTFDEFIGELRSNYSHDYSCLYIDKPNIIELFNETDFVNDSGQMNFSAVNINWYVNSEFWEMNYNESLIASLYFVLDLERHRDSVIFEIWNTGDDAINVNNEKPFGNKNLTGNYSIHILPL